MNQFTERELNILAEAVQSRINLDHGHGGNPDLATLAELTALADKVVSMQEGCQGFEPDRSNALFCTNCGVFENEHE